MNLGAQKVKRWRKAQCPKLTQADMTPRFGLSSIMWSRIERGERKPPLNVAVKLEAEGVCAGLVSRRRARRGVAACPL